MPEKLILCFEKWTIPKSTFFKTEPKIFLFD